MNRKDKDRLLVVACIGALIALVVASYLLGKSINPLYVGLIVIAVQQIYLIPKIHVLYTRLLGAPTNIINTFTPFWNEISIAHPVASIGILTCLCVSVLLVGASFINPSIIVKIFGEVFAFRYTYVFLLLAIVCYGVLCIFRGFGYNAIYRYVISQNNLMSQSNDKDLWGRLSVLMYLFFYIPILRVLALTYLLDKLNKLVVLNKLEIASESAFVEEE